MAYTGGETGESTVYGQGGALPARKGMKSKITFDAIVAGERTSTSRKTNSKG